jgi:hypothetical protein
MNKLTLKKIKRNLKKNKNIKKRDKTKKYRGGGQGEEYKSYKTIINKIKPDYTYENKLFDNSWFILSFMPLTTKYSNGLKLIKKSIGLFGMYIDNFYRLGSHNVINNILPDKVCSDLLNDYVCNTKIKDILSQDNNKGETLPQELRVVQGGGGNCSSNKFCHTPQHFQALNMKSSSIIKKTLKKLESYKLYRSSDDHYKYMVLLNKYTLSELVSLLSIYKFVNTKYDNYDIIEPKNTCKTSDDEYTGTNMTEAPKNKDYVNLIGPFKKVKDTPSDSSNIQELLLELLNLYDSCLNLNYYGIYPDNLKNEEDKREFEGLCDINCKECTVYSQSKIQTPEKNNVDIILSHIFYLMFNHFQFKKYKLRQDTILNNVYNMTPGNNFYKSKNERLRFNKNSIPLFIKEIGARYPDTSNGITRELQDKIKIYFDEINLPLYVCKMILYKIYKKTPIETNDLFR